VLSLIALSCLFFDCKKLEARLEKLRKGGSSSAPAATAIKRPSSDIVAATIFDGKLEPGWQDWGWGSHDLAHGSANIDFSNYGGFILWSPNFPSGVEGLAFRMSASASYGTFLEVKLAYQKNDGAFVPVVIGPEHTHALPGGWVEVYVAWSELNPSNLPVDQLTLHARTSVAKDFVRFDKIVLTAHDPKAKPPPPAKTDKITLRVDCRAPGHPISPYIYGVAGGGDPWDLAPTARRWGGNRTTRYNWQLLVTNVGKDWFFENVKEGGYREYVDDDVKHHAFTALTLPMIGWVAKDATSSGFPVSKLGPQQATDGYRPDAGNGVDKDGKPIRPGPPGQTSTAADPDFVRKWVEALRADDAKRGGRGVNLYFLDNEPALWSANHRDVHPDGVSYDELLDRTLRYAGAIRAADPQGLIAGPAEWGWSAYFFSAKDLETGATLRPDRRAHGDVPLIPWYLKQLHDHERTTGMRLLDVLDVHFYPQGQNVYGNAADSATAALRIRSTRALWDPSYKDESWINEPVRLIPRLKEWVAQNYPGLGVSIGEYSFGGEEHVSGALAEAEALGRFGSEGVDYAFYWFLPPKNSPTYWAFRAYRDFDGHGAHFLERSLATKMTPTVSLFASRDESSKHLVLIALNLDPSDAAQATIDLDGCAPVATSRRYVYTAHSQKLSAEGDERHGALNELLEPYSISVLDVTLK
jgi:hypothetical protein